MTKPRPIPSDLINDPDVRATYVKRIMTKVDWPSDVAGCWQWTGAKYWFGHGRIRWNRQAEYLVHRIMYAWWYGDTDKIIDHLCDNPSCVNPMHLRATTHRENVLRSQTGPSAVNARKTHCKRGHPFDEENTYNRPDGRRRCRECARILDRERSRKQRTTTGS